MPLIVKIQSKSDIITNSSSEVFPCVQYKYGAKEDLKELIDAILSAGGSIYSCDDLFDIDGDWNYITVKPLMESSKVKNAASVLNNLENLFEVCED